MPRGLAPNWYALFGKPDQVGVLVKIGGPSVNGGFPFETPSSPERGTSTFEQTHTHGVSRCHPIPTWQ